MGSAELIGDFHRAWVTTDPDERRALLEAVLVDDAELVDPRSGVFRGVDQIVERLAGFGARFPGARLDLTSGIDEHNGFARYSWAIADADGSAILSGVDFSELADGRLRRVVMFFGPLPG